MQGLKDFSIVYLAKKDLKINQSKGDVVMVRSYNISSWFTHTAITRKEQTNYMCTVFDKALKSNSKKNKLKVLGTPFEMKVSYNNFVDINVIFDSIMVINNKLFNCRTNEYIDLFYSLHNRFIFCTKNTSTVFAFNSDKEFMYEATLHHSMTAINSENEINDIEDILYNSLIAFYTEISINKEYNTSSELGIAPICVIQDNLEQINVYSFEYIRAKYTPKLKAIEFEYRMNNVTPLKVVGCIYIMGKTNYAVL